MRIMAIGDSITYGYIDGTNHESGGYRILLDQKLAAAGIEADFVGSQSSGPSTDNQHEGYPGWTIDALATKVHQVVPTYAPDVILLMAGNNDSGANTDAMMIDDMSRMIDLLSREAPNAVIMVAKPLPPQPNNTAGQSWGNIMEFNAALPDLISSKAAAGIRVQLVDTSGMTLADMSPVGADKGVHPTAQGYEKLANIWFDAIAHIGSLPATPPAPVEPGTGNPIVAVDDVYKTAIGTKLYVNSRYFAMNDRAPDGSATVVGVDSTSANGAVVTWATDGTTVYKPLAGWTGVDRFDYRVRDVDGSIDTGTIFVTVGTPPTITTSSGNPIFFTFDENTPAGTSIIDIDSTPGNSGVTPTWAITAGNAQGLFSINSTTGVLSFAGSADYEALAAAGVTTQVLTVKVLEGRLSDSQQVTVYINDVAESTNHPPVVSSPVTLEPLPENNSRVITPADLLANSSDPDAGTTLTVQNLTASSGSLSANSDGTWTFTPALNDTTDVTFSYLVSDGTNASPASATLDLVDTGEIRGTDGADTLNGVGAGAEEFHALAGNDTISANGGDDIIYGDGGNDTANGGDGNDTFVATTDAPTDGDDAYDGSAGLDGYDASLTSAPITANLSLGTASSAQIGTDSLISIEGFIGGSGNDSITGLATDDVLDGWLGNDTLDSGGGNDLVRGGAGDDMITAGSGNDVIWGGAGIDTVNGGDGNDRFVATTDAPNDGNDSYTGGAGIDIYDLSGTSANATVMLSNNKASSTQIGTDFLTGIEHVIGGAGDDSLTGLGSDDTLDGGPGNDSLNAGTGNDRLFGGTGDDLLNAGGGNDVLFGGDGTDTLDGGSGVESMTGGLGSDSFVFRHVGASATTSVTTGNTASTRDAITDFEPGVDKINLAAIDANRTSSTDTTDDAFVFVGFGSFAASPTTAAELRYHHETIGGVGHTIIEGTIDTLAGVDFQIDLVGTHTLTQTDFIL